MLNRRTQLSIEIFESTTKIDDVIAWFAVAVILGKIFEVTVLKPIVAWLDEWDRRQQHDRAIEGATTQPTSGARPDSTPAPAPLTRLSRNARTIEVAAGFAPHILALIFLALIFCGQSGPGPCVGERDACCRTR